MFFQQAILFEPTEADFREWALDVKACRGEPRSLSVYLTQAGPQAPQSGRGRRAVFLVARGGA